MNHRKRQEWLLIGLSLLALLLSACNDVSGTKQVAGTNGVPATLTPITNDLVIPATPTGVPIPNPGDATLPPRIIAFFPEAEQQQPADTELAFTVRFSRSMEKDSVTAAILMKPVVSGQVEWLDDVTLRYILPPQQSGASYQVVLTKAALAIDGTPVQKIGQAHIQIRDPIEVTSYSPINGSIDVRTDSDLHYVFNQPVVPAQCITPTQINTEDCSDLELDVYPPISGQGYWLSRSEYVFAPIKGWRSEETYVITLTGIVTLGENRDLASTLTHEFTVTLPELLSVYPSDLSVNIALDQPVVLRFNTAMDVASTSGAISVVSAAGQTVTGQGGWSEGNAVYTFQPSVLLNPQMTYFIVVEDKARANSSMPLINPHSTSFSTTKLPGVVSVSPEHGVTGVPLTDPVRVKFDGHMDSSSLPEHVIISPTVKSDAAYTFYDDSTGTLTLNWQKQPRTEYCIRIEPGVRDLYGNALAEFDETCFMTDDLPGVFLLDYQDQKSIYLDAVQPSYIDVQSVNIEEATFEIYALTPEQYASGDLISGDSLRVWTEEFDTVPNTVVHDSVALRRLKGILPTGYYGLRWESAGGSETASIVVVDTNLQLMVTAKEALIWATDLRSSQPISLTTVQLINQDGLLIAGGTTDHDGVARVPISQNTAGIRNIVAYVGEPESERFGATKVDDFESTTSAGDSAVILWSDRSTYAPGDVVLLAGIAVQYADAQFNSVIPSSAFELIVRDMQSHIIERKMISLSSSGNFQANYYLPRDVSEGIYSFEVQRIDDEPDSVATHAIEVTSSGSGSCQVMLTDFDSVFVTGEDHEITMDLTQCSDDLLPDAYTVGWRVVGQNQTTISSGVSDIWWGEFADFTVSIPDAVGRPESAVLEISVLQDNVLSGLSRSSIVLTDANIHMQVIAPAYVAGSGRRISTSVIAQDFTGHPIADLPVSVRFLTCDQPQHNSVSTCSSYSEFDAKTDIVTDAEGEAQTSFTSPTPGFYEIEVSALDDDGHLSVTRAPIIVTDHETIYRSAKNAASDTELYPIGDKPIYIAGETAKILIPTLDDGPFMAFIATGYDNVFSTQYMIVEHANPIVEVPLSGLATAQPYVDVHITIVRPYDEETEYPSVGYGNLRLWIAKPESDIQVTTQLDQLSEGYQLDVSILEMSGQPMSADVYVLAQTETQNISQQTLPLLPESLFTAVLNGQVILTGNSGADSEPVPVGSVVHRFGKNVDYLAYEVLKTDANGHLSLPVEIPCSVQTVHVTLLIISETGYRTVQREITLDSDVCIDMNLPARLNVGDTLVLPVDVYYSGSKPVTTQAEMTSTGAVQLIDAVQEITLEPGVSTINWEMQVVESSMNSDLLTLSIKDNTGDIMSRRTFDIGGEFGVPVYENGLIPQIKLPSDLVIASSKPEHLVTIAAPNPVEISVIATTDLVSWITSKIKVSVPDEGTSCALVSSAHLLQCAVLSDLQRQDGIPLVETFSGACQHYLDQLYQQQRIDGGWGLSSTTSNPQITSYVGYALIRVKRAGYPIDDTRLDQTLQYLSTYLEQSVASDDFAEVVNWSHSLAYYTLSLAGVEWPGQVMQMLYQERHNLSLHGQAWLALAIGEVDDADPRATTMIAELLESIHIDGTYVMWPMNEIHWDSPFDTSAVILKAITALSEDDEYIPDVLSRTINQWAGQDALFQSTSILDALTEYILNDDIKSQPSMIHVDLNEHGLEPRKMAEGVWNGVGELGSGSNTLCFTPADPKVNYVFDVSLQPTERIWLDQSSLTIDSGIWVDQRLVMMTNSLSSTVAKQSVVESTIGDIILLQSNIILSADRPWVQILQPLPSAVATIEDKCVLQSDPTTELNVWQNVEDGVLKVIVDYLPSGTYTLTCEIEPRYTGKYIVHPAQVRSLFQSKVFATSSIVTLAVQE